MHHKQTIEFRPASPLPQTMWSEFQLHFLLVIFENKLKATHFSSKVSFYIVKDGSSYFHNHYVAETFLNCCLPRIELFLHGATAYKAFKLKLYLWKYSKNDKTYD